MLYIKKEKNIKKSYIIFLLEIGFIILDKKNKIIFAIIMGYITENIKENIMPIILNKNICKAKSLYINISEI